MSRARGRPGGAQRFDVMRLLDGLHRWSGGLIGLLLVVIGFSGLTLVHKDAWLRATLPHAADARSTDAGRTVSAMTAIFSDPRATSVILASPSLSVHRVTYGDVGHGAYVDQTGRVVTRWDSKWARPEVWLFDLHHYLLAGDVGKTVAGFAGLTGIGFVVTGVILWWRTRRSFEWRLWPRAWTRFGILRHHRDLGVLAAPLLIVTFATGAMMTLKPIEAAVLSLFSSRADLAAAVAIPARKGGAYVPGGADWARILQTAGRRFPDAQVRVITVPSKPGALIAVRLRQSGEPTPNGRTFLWFDPADGALVGVRDARALPTGARIAAYEYPIHSGKIGGWFWIGAITLSGLALITLGGFGVYTFWFNRRSPRKPVRRRVNQA
ncbi:MAG: PepSY-associated TM helix domain-containing protein [Candidatus Brevundimonas colombiensis]|uniref:PepSY-associated TM helix domain-containing protein n=1 Tax=Candidatus Brevundimonas colombiensis TaxID=3121376 RepID=A0AAJ5X5B9_9CAUL|nr:PepSY-associated TM helix domain-containing protein [Brevundimonas sp.]WEK40680.1 MAG: PepSY-associated TM helix domain-containing protein [Brevundimonas sp.]